MTRKLKLYGHNMKSFIYGPRKLFSNHSNEESCLSTYFAMQILLLCLGNLGLDNLDIIRSGSLDYVLSYGLCTTNILISYQ